MIQSLLSVFILSSTPLVIDEVYTLDVRPGGRFDLSGLLATNEVIRKELSIKADYILVDDKSSHLWLGTTDKKNRLIRLEKWVDLQSAAGHETFDFEDLEYVDGKIYAVNEVDGTLYELTPGDKPKLAAHFWENTASKNYPFDSRYGIEGLTFANGEFILSKELPPLVLFHVTLSPEPANRLKRVTPRASLGSQTSIRYREGSFYLVDREARCVWKFQKPDVKEECLSFSAAAQDPRLNYLVKDRWGKPRPEWGTAEALDITKDSIIIGLDNNGLPLVSDLKETRPKIVVFMKP